MQDNLCVGLDFSKDIDAYVSYISLLEAKLYKINPAFISYLNIRLVARYLNNRNIKWIYDAKYGDVYHTNIKYAEYVFEELGASAVTLNPYVGFESLQPFFDYKDKQCFILCKTTHEGHSTFQSPEKVIEFVRGKPNVGIVYASNDMKGLAKIAKQLPETKILSPGIGIQGGVIQSSSKNIIYSVSRSIYQSEYPKETYQAYLDKLILLQH